MPVTVDVKNRLLLMNPPVPPISRGIMPTTPNSAVSLNEYPAQAPVLSFGEPTIDREFIGLQVRVRGESQQYDEPRAVAERIRTDLAGVQGMILGTTLYFMIRPTGAPTVVDRETSGSMRVTWGVSFIIEKRPG